jgi:hypothetical protein
MGTGPKVTFGFWRYMRLLEILRNNHANESGERFAEYPAKSLRPELTDYLPFIGIFRPRLLCAYCASGVATALAQRRVFRPERDQSTG